ncbi:MAG: LCP family protein [Firmicutes bacterium]|nr:LCP family protein [Bacillota bacterium]
MSENIFWEQDRTTIHQKRSWFFRLTTPQRICFVLIVLFVLAWFFYLGFVSAVAAAEKLEGEVVTAENVSAPPREDIVSLEGTRVILLVGADNREGENAGRTDTIILAFLDMTNKSVKLLSIPRDTYVQIPGTSTKTKINHSFFYGGINLTMKTIEDFLGVEIDGYVLIDFQGFTDLIDAIGGVEVDVETDMYKKWENIDLKAGSQTLDGVDALAYVRYRDTATADIGRIERQQKFLKLLADKLFSLSNVLKTPQLVSIAMDNVTTSFSLSECLSMATALSNMDLDNLQTYMVPGVGKYLPYGNQNISFWVVSPNKLRSMLVEITGNEDINLHLTGDEGSGVYSIPSQADDDEVEEEETARRQHTDSNESDTEVTVPDGGEEIDTGDTGEENGENVVPPQEEVIDNWDDSQEIPTDLQETENAVG